MSHVVSLSGCGADAPARSMQAVCALSTLQAFPLQLEGVTVSRASSREPLGLPVGGPRGGKQAA